jgi:hypothetical protein
LLDLARREALHVRKARNHSNGVLNGPQGQSIGAREQESGNQCRLYQGGLKQLGETRTVQPDSGSFFPPQRGFREERANQEEGNRWNQSREQSVTPGLMATRNASA